MKSAYSAIAAGLLVLGLATGCTQITGGSANSGSETQTTGKPQIYAEDGIAIRGTDPVAYFIEGKPVAGSSEFSHEWNGATWHFASAESRDLFAADPEKYAPQYGGYCAWAVSQGGTAAIDPEAWKIVDGKLYLNYSKGIQQKWEKDVPGNIAKADANWLSVLNK